MTAAPLTDLHGGAQQACTIPKWSSPDKWFPFVGKGLTTT